MRRRNVLGQAKQVTKSTKKLRPAGELRDMRVTSYLTYFRMSSELYILSIPPILYAGHSVRGGLLCTQPV